MIDGIPVFDCVIHVYDLSDENLRKDEPTSAHARDHIASLQSASRAAPYHQACGIARRWTLEAAMLRPFVTERLGMEVEGARISAEAERGFDARSPAAGPVPVLAPRAESSNTCLTN